VFQLDLNIFGKPGYDYKKDTTYCIWEREKITCSIKIIREIGYQSGKNKDINVGCHALHQK
jgi:hypothetical protein